MSARPVARVKARLRAWRGKGDIAAYLEAGAVLADLRQSARRGEWAPLLARIGLSERTARQMMALARSGMTAGQVAAAGGVWEALRQARPPRGAQTSKPAPPDAQAAAPEAASKTVIEAASEAFPRSPGVERFTMLRELVEKVAREDEPLLEQAFMATVRLINIGLPRERAGDAFQLFVEPLENRRTISRFPPGHISVFAGAIPAVAAWRRLREWAEGP